MAIFGIIAEYNPFHNGHLYQINKVKEIYKPDCLIAITTNYFQMMGDISVIDKYEKTKASIDNGIDLVIDYPYLLSCTSAILFAKNAVDILAKLKVTHIAAGSESADINLIKEISKLEERQEFQDSIKKYINQGVSYRKAFSSSLLDFKMPDIKSNDLLNLKYYDAIKEGNYDIELVLIERTNNNYISPSLEEGSIQSARAIRSLIKENKDISSFVPPYIANLSFLDINNFSSFLKYQILNSNLANVYEAKEGIENLFTTKFATIDELKEQLVSKRYKSSRIGRFISYILTNYTKDISIPNDYPVRPLGFNNNGKKYLNTLKKDLNSFTTIKEGINPIYDFEIKIAKIFSLVFDKDFIKIEQALPYIKED